MTAYPYTLKTGTLKKFFDKVPHVGIPEKVTQKFLATLDFKSSNDRKMLSTLRFLKFTDESGAPTERYKQYRDRSKSRSIMGTAVREAYHELFRMYPDADQKDHQSLQNFFSTETGLGSRAVKASAETFKALCSLSEFTQLDDTYESSATPPLSSEANASGLAMKDSAQQAHVIERVLSDGRRARIILPEDVSPAEIDKVKKVLDAFK